MDYRGFLDFVLAAENRNTPQALAYFFRLLDLRKLGYIDAFAIHYFFREVAKRLPAGEKVTVEDVKTEIFDMVKPKNALAISFADLLACNAGGTVVRWVSE